MDETEFPMLRRRGTPVTSEKTNLPTNRLGVHALNGGPVEFEENLNTRPSLTNRTELYIVLRMPFLRDL